MPDYAGYDISIAGQNYKLMRNSVGALALRFGASADEPGQTGQVGTIPFDNLHHGLGPNLSMDGDKTVASEAFSTMRPGRLEYFGNNNDTNCTVDGGVVPGAAQSTTINRRIYATSFQNGDDIYFVMPQRVIKFASGSTAGTTVFTAAGSDYIRGPGANYRGKWFFGLQNANGQAIGHLEFQPATNNWFANKLANHTKASLFFSVHTALWILEVTVASATVPGEVDWIIKRSDAEDCTQEAAFSDLTVEKSQPYPTAIHPLARWLMVFGSDGEVDAISADGGAPVSITPPGAFPGKDYSFGIGATMWGDLLMVPSIVRGLMALSLSGSPLRDVQPINVNPGLGLSAIETYPVAQYGADLIVGTGGLGSTINPQALGLRRYGEGVFYQGLYGGDVATGFTLVGGSYRCYSVQIREDGRAYFLFALTNGSTPVIRILDLPPKAGGRPLSLAAGQAWTYWQSAYTFGPSMGKKLALQARAWIESTLTNCSLKIQSSYDGAAFADMVSGQAAGLMVGDAGRGLGRSIAIRVMVTGTPSASDWPVLLLPIFIDYMDEPQAGNRLEFDIDARGGFVRAGISSASRLSIFNTLKAMEGTSQALVLLESTTPYNAIIERVESEDNYGPTGRERPSAVVKVAVRILA